MLVTNTTDHCFVLSAGVVLRPNAVYVEVDDAAYAADSTLNSQLDALEAEGFVTTTRAASLATDTGDVNSDIVFSWSAVGDAGNGKEIVFSDATNGVLSASGNDSSGWIVHLVVANDVISTTAAEVADLFNNVLTTNIIAALVGTGASTMPDAELTFPAAHGLHANFGLLAGGSVKPTDPFSPILQSQSPVTLQAHVASEVPLTLDAASGQSANLLEVYDEDGHLVGETLPDGTFVINSPGSEDGGVTIGARFGSSFESHADQITVALRAAPSQTTNLLEATDEDGDLVAWISADGSISSASQIQAEGAAGVGGAYGIFDGHQNGADAANVVLYVDGKNGQTGHLVQVKDGSGHDIFQVRADGTVHIKTGTTIHADL